MSQEITVTRYLFSELSDEAKEKAIENEQRCLSEFMDTDLVTEAMKEKLAYLISGDYETANELEISWDLSYSQGSGVSFEGRLEKDQAPNLAWPEKATYARFTRTSHHYSHAYTVKPDIYDEEGEDISDDEVKTFRESYLNICGALEKFGYALIDDLTSRETALENLSNPLTDEAVFMKDGTFNLPRE